MLWSKMFIPTLREDPASVEAASHRLLVRAGYIRQLTAGVYSLLPLAQRVRLKVMNIIRQEMESIGAQEFLLPALQPMELWEESGRKETVAEIMFQLTDRKGSSLALGLTHEEVFTSIARATLNSYRQLPQIWYQMQTKFRDEARPRGGLLRTREFTMKDSYSFDLDESGLDQSFQRHAQAYDRIFRRCGLNFLPVQADSGAMGGSASTEYMVLTDCGEDSLVTCSNCQYAANIERAQALASVAHVDEETINLETFDTPGVRTIRDLEKFAGATATNQIKTLIYEHDGRLSLVLLRGDQELNEAKLIGALKCNQLRPADESRIFETMGAHAGSLGACGVRAGDGQKVSTILADERLRGRRNMVTGANKDDVHVRGVCLERDINVDRFLDLHKVHAGEACIECGGSLKLVTGLEIGHIFKLGTRYSESMNARVLQADGTRSPLLMGSYGIGVERLMAAVVEQNHDAKGMRWPMPLAPFQVIIVLLNSADEKQRGVAQRLYSELTGAGVDTLLDDRDERAGVKFNDSELIGVPLRITVGKKAASGIVELFDRFSLQNIDLEVEEALVRVKTRCQEQ